MSSIDVMQRSQAAGLSASKGTKTVKRAKVNQWRPLKPEFEPGPFDVICARGKDAREHVGNRRMRLTIEVSLDRYRAASTKHEKSNIVWRIIDAVRNQSPDGGFVKFKDGRWHEVGDHWAREKIGQSFRDRLHMNYKSSSRAKTIRKKKTQATSAADTPIDILHHNNGEDVNEHLMKVSSNLFASDSEDFTKLLVQANSAMLNDMKKESNIFMPEQHNAMPAPPAFERDTSNLFAAPPAPAQMSMFQGNASEPLPVDAPVPAFDLASLSAIATLSRQQQNNQPCMPQVPMQQQQQQQQPQQQPNFDDFFKGKMLDPIPISTWKNQRPSSALSSIADMLGDQASRNLFEDDDINLFA
eukprot:CAMPEP_0119556206 /NCGR_PEP_ID=MMETSP1352-20130426/8224_1 /TAXON_ID=265584 /ORGANISM="Stauroneis constricta, Strain CCMP1120" /LENGTH=355 /DNA_ID=CAMNT_0007603119 /DNA_START=158 /DNA_END=1225 /DNA_ORIENTATION=+